MSEIQRYTLRQKRVSHNYLDMDTDDGHLVDYKDHLADKKAALEAQAEEHSKELAARDEQLEFALSQQIIWQRRYDAVNAEIEALREAHSEDIATREDIYRNALAALRREGEPALIQFEHPALHKDGAKCMIHRDYRPTMEKLCDIAYPDVQLFITHSFRPLNAKLIGKIVEEADRSNHHAGSGSDLNVVYGKEWFNSEKLSLDGLLGLLDAEHPVGVFIDNVREDRSIRWGGDFAHKDAVHFDDDLVRRDPAEWQRRVEQLTADAEKEVQGG